MKRVIMGYNLGVCPQCKNVMSMPDDSATVRCPSCKNEVSAIEAARLAGESGQQQPGFGAPIAPPNGAFLQSWKTSALFTAIGIIAAAIINSFVSAASNAALGEGASSLGMMQGIFAILYLAFCIMYAAKIYPSYFADKPMLESSEAVSFMNGFVGGLIFGLIWNHNLTLKNKGVAHIVYLVLLGLSLASVLGIALVTPIY